MTDKNDFDLGRLQGRSGFGGSDSRSPAYRQGLLQGATERQNDILREQARREEERRAEDSARDERREQQIRDAIQEEEWSRQAQAEREQRSLDEAKAAQRLVCALENMSTKKAVAKPIVRDALHFAAKAAAEFRSSDWRVWPAVSNAGKKLTEKYPVEPGVHDSIVRLAHALLIFRSVVAGHGLILPCNRNYNLDMVPSTFDQQPRSFESTEPASWFDKEAGVLSHHGDALPTIAKKWISEPDVVIEHLSEGLDELRQLSKAAAENGLWQIQPRFLGYTFINPSQDQGDFAAIPDMVDIVLSHRDFLIQVEGDQGNTGLIERWLLTPCEGWSEYLAKIQQARNEVQSWLAGDPASWPQFSEGLGDWQQYGGVPFLQHLREAVSLLDRRACLLNHGSWRPMVPPGDADRIKQTEDLNAALKREEPLPEDVLRACVTDPGPRGSRWTLAEVDRKSAQAVCSLLAPISSWSVREAWMVFASGIILWIVVGKLIGWGVGFFAFAITAVISLLSMNKKYSQAYIALVREAGKANPKFTNDEMYRLVYSMRMGMMAFH